MGAVLVSRNTTNISNALVKSGVSAQEAHRVAASFGFGQALSVHGQSGSLVHGIQLAFAHSTQSVFYVMAAVMAATFLVAIRAYPRGRAQQAPAAGAERAALEGGLEHLGAQLIGEQLR